MTKISHNNCNGTTDKSMPRKINRCKLQKQNHCDNTTDKPDESIPLVDLFEKKPEKKCAEQTTVCEGSNL